MIDYSYLGPPQEAENIVHSEHYIKHQEQEQGVRKIYETVVYDKFEIEKIKELKEEIKKQKILLCSDWKESDYLRISYAGRFNKKEVIKKLQQHIAWRCNKINHEINPQLEQFLKEGICYLLGRDIQFRPIIILNAHLIDQKKVNDHDKEFIFQALSFILGIVKKYMLIPGKVETWIFILETNNLGGQGLQQKVLDVLIEGLSTNFSDYLEKMFILNPSSGINFLWQQIKTYLNPETINKISFLSQKELKKLQEFIQPNQLEEKFGGNQSNLTKFWPPYNLDLSDGYTMKDNKTNQNQNLKVQNIKIDEEEEENDPYDQVEFNLNDFMKQQQQIYYVVSNKTQQEIHQENKNGQELIEKSQSKEDPQQESQQKHQQLILDEPEQPELQEQIIHQDKEKKQIIVQNNEIKESTEQVIITERQKICQQQVNDTEQNKLLTHDEQGNNSFANKLNEESHGDNIIIQEINIVNNNKCCSKCEIF